MNIIIILGPPCSGKGTICNLLKNKINYTHISIGEELRKKYAIGTPIRTLIDAGNMADENIIIDILNTLTYENILLDGFPRTIDQIFILNKLNVNIQYIFILETDKDILIKRMINRQICNKCNKSEHTECNGVFIRRDDDVQNIYEQRYNTYINNINEISTKLNQYNIFKINNSNISSEDTMSIIYKIINK